MRSRAIASAVHIVIAVYQFACIYTPLRHWRYALPIVQWGTFPLLAVTGFWMMYGRWRRKAHHRCSA